MPNNGNEDAGANAPKGTFLTVIHNPVHDPPIRLHRELLERLDKEGIPYEARPSRKGIKYVSEIWRTDV